MFVAGDCLCLCWLGCFGVILMACVLLWFLLGSSVLDGPFVDYGRLSCRNVSHFGVMQLLLLLVLQHASILGSI